MIIDIINQKIDFERVMNIIEAPKEGECRKEMYNMAKSLEGEFFKAIKPKAYFKFIKSNKRDYNYKVPVIYTLGELIEKHIEYSFTSGEYIKALILNAMADDFIMSSEKFVMEKIKKEAKKIKTSVSCKITPFETGKPSMQKDICDMLEVKEISVNDCYVLSPTKSISFMLMCKAGIENESILHNCILCKSLDCKWRKSHA